MSTKRPGRTIVDGPRRRTAGRLVAGGFALLFLAGAALLALAVVEIGPAWLDGIGSVAVVTAMSWALGARTGGRALVSAVVAAVLGAAALVVDSELLRTGAAVLTAVVAGVLGVMVTVPAVRVWGALREAVVAVLVGAVGAFAVLGFEPVVNVVRFEYASMLAALVLALALVHRLGASLHGLGRRGLLLVLVGTAVLVLTLAYAELLRRYGVAPVVEPLQGAVQATRETLGAFPRPIMVLLGVPALVWGCHMRARRPQGWWACTFGVAAPTAAAQALINPTSSYVQAGLQVGYGLLCGLVVGLVLVRIDLWLTAPRGRPGRRVEEAGAGRPEPRRWSEL